MCARTRTPIVESHVYGDITFADRIASLKSLDSAGLVIFQGSASKIISPALRIGWLVAPPAALELLAPAKASLDLSTPTLTQAVLAAFLKSPAYGRHQEKFRDALRTRRDVMIAALGKHCPDLRYAPPEGGLYLWAQLPGLLPAREFEAVAAAEGVGVRSGDSFLTNGGASSHIRLCFAAPAQEEILIGVQRMGRALRNLLQRHKASGALESSFASV
jgi:DNA-binding transcriptional MocR family regulator